MKSALEQFCTEKLIERKNQIINRQAARIAELEQQIKQSLQEKVDFANSKDTGD